MDGRMTYADEGGLTSRFYRWANGVDIINAWIDTTSTETGQVIFEQQQNSVNDIVVTAGDFYSPDLNVPFNIAVRHGSTFLNGAADGIALTANTTPVALPDLSSTDLSLGYDYMGTIKHFRIWAEDIGDDGIVHGSTDIPEVVGLPEIGVY